MQSSWNTLLESHKIKVQKDVKVSAFLVSPTQLQSWTREGLSHDEYFRENAANLSQMQHWPVLLDPHGIAHGWIQNKERFSNLVVLRSQDSDLVGRIEIAVASGHVLLFHHLSEALVELISPILKAGRTSVRPFM